MKVGVLGSGDVGRSLGLGFASHGHVVMIGTRHPDKPELAEWRQKAGTKATVGSFSDTAAHGNSSSCARRARPRRRRSIWRGRSTSTGRS